MLRSLLKNLYKRWLSPLSTSGGEAANEATPSDFRAESAANDYRADEKGWFQVSPFGEFNHTKGLQVFQREDAERIVTAFNSVKNTGRRLFGLPFYVGHPDADKSSYPDDKAYGRIKELEVRDDGLWGRSNFSANGKALIEEGAYDGHSPYWRFIHDPKRRGAIRPVELISVGLTNSPNLPVIPITAAALNEQTNMNEYLKKLAKLLGLDESAANEAAIETQIANAMTAMNAIGGVRTELSTAQGKVTTLTTDLSAANASLATIKGELTAANGKVTTLTTEKDNALTAVNSERLEREKLILDAAINSGAITQAEKPAIEAELKGAKELTAFNAVANRIQTKASQLFTTSMAQGRTAANGKAGEDGWKKYRSAVNEKMKKDNCSYETAWNSLKDSDEYAGLFKPENKP